MTDTNDVLVKEYKKAEEELKRIENTTDAENWNLLMFGTHPDKELQDKVNALCDVVSEYEDAVLFEETVRNGDFILGK